MKGLSVLTRTWHVMHVAVGGSVTGHAAGVPYPLVVLRAGAAQMLAFDARCPHLGCAVRGAAKLFICPCHNGTFDPQGNATGGPPFDAGQKLSRFPLQIENGLLYIEVPLA